MNKLIVFACLLAVCYGAAVPAKLHRRPVLSNSRIVGGTETNITEVPYLVALEWNGWQFCGGAIISENYIVTGVQCTDFFPNQELTIRTGSSNHEDGGTVIQVKKVNVSPKYDPSTSSHDVAILELDEPISLSDKSAIIPLTEKEPQAGDQVLVSGWGLLAEGGDQPSSLQSVVLPVVDRAVCNRIYEHFNHIDSTMICAGVEGEDACQGDSGGPLVLDGKLVGIVSWGFGCGDVGYPGVYTNISDKDVREFIRATTNV